MYCKAKGYFIVLIAVFLFVEMNAQEHEFEAHQRVQEARQFIREKSRDSTLYVGVGDALILSGDIGSAREEAKRRALSRLSESIHVQIASDITEQVTTRERARALKSEREVELRELVQVYSGIEVEGTREEYFDFFPDNHVTSVVWVEKRLYEEQVQKRIRENSTKVRTALNTAIRHIEGGRIVQGFGEFIKAHNYLDKYFKRVPMQYDIRNDGTIEDVKTFVVSSVSNILANIRLEVSEGNYTFDNNGNLNRIPHVTTFFYDNNGNSIPVSQLPLIFVVSDLSEREIHARTAGNGRANISVGRVSPTLVSVSIKISLDLTQYEGFDLVKVPHVHFPEATLVLHKRKTVALSVANFFGNQRVAAQNLEGRIRRKVIDKGYDGALTPTSAYDVEQEFLSDINRQNIEYLMVVHLRSGQATTVGGYRNMFASHATGVVSLYEFPGGFLLGSTPLPSVRGMGTNAHAASSDALSKLQSTALSEAKQLLEYLQ